MASKSYCRCDTPDNIGMRGECGRGGVQCKECRHIDEIARLNQQLRDAEYLHSSRKTLLASCEAALDERDQENQQLTQLLADEREKANARIEELEMDIAMMMERI